jgi:hypothetical protein
VKNKIEDLRNHLFEAIEKVKDGDMPLDRAKMVAELAQVVINSAKAEADFIRAIGGSKGTGFINEGERPALPNRPALVVKR